MPKPVQQAAASYDWAEAGRALALFAPHPDLDEVVEAAGQLVAEFARLCEKMGFECSNASGGFILVAVQPTSRRAYVHVSEEPAIAITGYAGEKQLANIILHVSLNTATGRAEVNVGDGAAANPMTEIAKAVAVALSAATPEQAAENREKLRRAFGGQ